MKTVIILGVLYFPMGFFFKVAFEHRKTAPVAAMWMDTLALAIYAGACIIAHGAAQ